MAGTTTALESGPPKDPLNTLNSTGKPGTLGSTTVVNVDQVSLDWLRGPSNDIWDRIRRGFAMQDLEGTLVDDRTQWYAARPDYMERMVGRSSRYLYHIVEELERRKMPTELALLPFVESAFNPQAESTAKAAGMWQFIPSTGKSYNLKQNMFRDERRDVLASTDAALDYLSRLLRHVRRLAPGAGRVQLGRGRRLAGHRTQPGARPAHGLRQPDHAERDALLRAQAPGGEEHHRQPGHVWREAARDSRSPVLRHRDHLARTSMWRWPPSWPICRWTSSRR